MSCESENGINIHAGDSQRQPLANGCGRRNYASSGSRDMLLPNVFVQIPTNHVVVPSLPRVPIGREIKAEPPIKFEIDNVQQQQLSGQRFPTKDVENTISNQFQREHFAEVATSSTSSTELTSSVSLVTARPKSAAVKCFKCTLCPFMSITQSGHDGHMANVHANHLENSDDTDKMFRKKILCPGCENVFYSKKSLKIHLANDHQMSASEIMPLLDSLFAQSDSKTKKSTMRQQKIYLKNVEVLKNPQFSASQFARHKTIDSSSIEPPPNDTIVAPSMSEYVFDDSHLNGVFGSTESRMCDLIADLEPSYSLEVANVAESVSNDNMAITPDDTMSVRPDSGNSIKYSENAALSNSDGWTNANNNLQFPNYEQPTTNWDFISDKRSTADSTSPMPSTSSTSSFSAICQNEKKKIFIKNIDILKDPLITPATSMCAESTTGRKNMLHLRTVDEVNLMLSHKVQNENNNNYATSTEVITLDEDDYHYVLNDGVDYNTGIMPQYFESEMNELVSNYLTTCEYMPNYATPSSFSLTNLETAASIANGDDGVIVLDANADESTLVDQQRNSEQFPTSFYARSMNGDGAINSHVIDYDFLSNKFMQSREMDGPDYMIVSSDTIIDATDDILDLTNDEVDQIIDNNLIESQCFDGFGHVAHEPVTQPNKARINVVGNLMRAEFTTSIDDTNHAADVRKMDLVCGVDEAFVQSTIADAFGQAKKRSGRPKGARKTYGVTSKVDALPYKCRINDCAMRFASENVLSLHEQCHDTTDADTEFRCPKCVVNADEVPRKWIYNTVATHLWRKHSIDLELYSCTYPDCNFKTPILSRLKNTHMKIHSETRDFKCDRCEKAFKNSKQLKNHRRIHTKLGPLRIRKCPHCEQSYSMHYIKEHLLTHSATSMSISSETSLLKNSKQFECTECAYHSFDRNAFRRHQMVHSKQMKYKCPLCTFQAIQSTNYKNHIIKKHPESAKELIFMCDKCNFVTVNQNLFYVHCLNHNS